MKRLLIFSLIGLLILATIGCEGVNSQSNGETIQDKTSSNVSEGKDDANEGSYLVDSKADSDNNVVTIYFSDSDALGLVGEERTIDNITPEALINELIKGPQDPNNKKTIPDGTKLLGIEIKDKIAYVDFSKELKENHWGGSTGELFTIFSIVNSLVLQPDLDIEKVQILIEGQAVDSLAGHADISVPLEPDLQMVDMK